MQMKTDFTLSLTIDNLNTTATPTDTDITDLQTSLCLICLINKNYQAPPHPTFYQQHSHWPHLTTVLTLPSSSSWRFIDVWLWYIPSQLVGVISVISHLNLSPLLSPFVTTLSLSMKISPSEADTQIMNVWGHCSGAFLLVAQLT